MLRLTVEKMNMADQHPKQAKQRARYSTSWPASSTGLAQRLREDAAPDTGGAFALSVNQWTVLIGLGVVLFIGLALVTGVVVGRALRGPLAVRASTAVPAGSAVIAEAQPLLTQPEVRVDPWPRSGARDTGVSLLFNDVLVAGDAAPDFHLEALDGDTMSLSHLKGRTVLVNFWATWCNWCKYELPALQAAYEKYQNKGLVVVGVDVEEPRPLVEAYVQRYGLLFPVVLDIEGTTAEAYRVRGLPMTYFINPDGVIVHVQRGAMREDELELYVRDVLAAD